VGWAARPIPPCGQSPGGDISRGATARTRSPSARRTAATPTAPRGPQRAEAPGRLPRHGPQDAANQQDRVISARVPRAEYLRDERAGGPRPLRPPARQASRSPGPPPRPSPHPPFPARPAPGNRPGSGRTQGHARSALPRTSSRAPRRLRRPGRGSSVDAAPVRGRPCKADGPAHRSHAPIPVRYASVDSAI